MSDKDHKIMPLSALLGADPVTGIELPVPEKMHHNPGVFNLGGHYTYTPSPHAHGVDWENLSQGSAPSCLGRLEMPIAHLSIQIAWLHSKVNQAAARTARANLTRYRKVLRRQGDDLPLTPQELALKKAKHANYMKQYRRRRRLEILRIRGKTLTPDELLELLKRRKRAEKIKRTKAKQRRREIKRAYVDAMIRDAARRRAEIKGK